MSRWSIAGVVIAALVLRGDSALEQRGRNKVLNFTSVFPPVWKQGDHWSVAMKTLEAAPDDAAPGFVEYIFDFRVTGIPGAEGSLYRVEARSHDGNRDETYELSYRGDYSLAAVTRYDHGTAGRRMVENGVYPFIYYQRRLPIVPDFPIGVTPNAEGRHEFLVAGNRVVQEIQAAGDGARITLERIEASGTLRVSMEWAAGDPWWSVIECSENPPPGFPFRGQVVASGHLLKENLPAGR